MSLKYEAQPPFTQSHLLPTGHLKQIADKGGMAHPQPGQVRGRNLSKRVREVGLWFVPMSPGINVDKGGNRKYWGKTSHEN